MPGTAFFDLDKTITDQGTWSRFVRFAAKSNAVFLAALPAIGTQAARYKSGFASRGSVKETAIRLLLAGRSREDLETLADRFADREVQTGIRPGALASIERHRENGDRLIIASAAADLIVAPIASRLGINDLICTQLSWTSDNRLSAGLNGENCYGDEKLNRVIAFASDQSLSGPVWFYSDHVSDLGCLEWADHGVAVNPSAALKREALRKNIPIQNWTH